MNGWTFKGNKIMVDVELITSELLVVSVGIKECTFRGVLLKSTSDLAKKTIFSASSNYISDKSSDCDDSIPKHNHLIFNADITNTNNRLPIKKYLLNSDNNAQCTVQSEYDTTAPYTLKISSEPLCDSLTNCKTLDNNSCYTSNDILNNQNIKNMTNIKFKTPFYDNLTYNCEINGINNIDPTNNLSETALIIHSPQIHPNLLSIDRKPDTFSTSLSSSYENYLDDRELLFPKAGNLNYDNLVPEIPPFIGLLDGIEPFFDPIDVLDDSNSETKPCLLDIDKLIEGTYDGMPEESSPLSNITECPPTRPVFPQTPIHSSNISIYASPHQHHGSKSPPCHPIFVDSIPSIPVHLDFPLPTTLPLPSTSPTPVGAPGSDIVPKCPLPLPIVPLNLAHLSPATLFRCTYFRDPAIISDYYHRDTSGQGINHLKTVIKGDGPALREDSIGIDGIKMDHSLPNPTDLIDAAPPDRWPELGNKVIGGEHASYYGKDFIWPWPLPTKSQILRNLKRYRPVPRRYVCLRCKASSTTITATSKMATATAPPFPSSNGVVAPDGETDNGGAGGGGGGNRPTVGSDGVLAPSTGGCSISKSFVPKYSRPVTRSHHQAQCASEEGTTILPRTEYGRGSRKIDGFKMSLPQCEGIRGHPTNPQSHGRRLFNCCSSNYHKNSRKSLKANPVPINPNFTLSPRATDYQRLSSSTAANASLGPCGRRTKNRPWNSAPALRPRQSRKKGLPPPVLGHIDPIGDDRSDLSETCQVNSQNTQNDLSVHRNTFIKVVEPSRAGKVSIDRVSSTLTSVISPSPHRVLPKIRLKILKKDGGHADCGQQPTFSSSASLTSYNMPRAIATDKMVAYEVSTLSSPPVPLTSIPNVDPEAPIERVVKRNPAIVIKPTPAAVAPRRAPSSSLKLLFSLKKILPDDAPLGEARAPIEPEPNGTERKRGRPRAPTSAASPRKHRKRRRHRKSGRDDGARSEKKREIEGELIPPPGDTTDAPAITPPAHEPVLGIGSSVIVTRVHKDTKTEGSTGVEVTCRDASRDMAQPTTSTSSGYVTKLISNEVRGNGFSSSVLGNVTVSEESADCASDNDVAVDRPLIIDLGSDDSICDTTKRSTRHPSPHTIPNDNGPVYFTEGDDVTQASNSLPNMDPSKCIKIRIKPINHTLYENGLPASNYPSVITERYPHTPTVPGKDLSVSRASVITRAQPFPKPAFVCQGSRENQDTSSSYITASNFSSSPSTAPTPYPHGKWKSLSASCASHAYVRNVVPESSFGTGYPGEGPSPPITPITAPPTLSHDPRDQGYKLSFTYRHPPEVMSPRVVGRCLRIGDIVWGKIQGYPWWPGRILTFTVCTNRSVGHLSTPRPSSPPPSSVVGEGVAPQSPGGPTPAAGKVVWQKCKVAWFGSSTTSELSCRDIVPFSQFYDVHYNRRKRGAFQDAVQQATLAEASRMNHNRP